MNASRLITRSLGACALAVALSACEGALNLDAAGNLVMTLQKMDQPALGFQPQGPEGSPRSVQPDTVSSLKVTVTSIQVFRATADSNGGMGWVTMQLNAPVTVDLMALPSEQQTATVLAGADVAAGSYTRVRLSIANPRITFRGDISFGIGGILQGGTEYGVALGATQTIEAAISANVQASASGGGASVVRLVFDEAASLGSVAVTGSGSVLLTAVLEQH